MISVEEAVEEILSRVGTLGDERVELVDALDRILAEEIVSHREIPPWPNSSMDGWAVRSADTGGAAPERPARLLAAGRVAAGAVAARALRAGEACRIFTGAPLPEGADAVIPQEDVSTDGDDVLVSAPVAAGAYVRPRGEDLRPGDRVLAPGRRLGSADIGVLATLGHHQVRVIRRPRVGILSTGDEIVDLGGTLGPGQIPNSNTYSLMAQVREAGGEPVNLGVARDALEDIERRLRAGLGTDLLISSAGVSVGDHDFVKAALGRLGAEQHLWLVNMRPGKPITFATVPPGPGGQGKNALPVFGLPGNPVSAMVTFELFVRPALRRLAGHTHLHRPVVRARALGLIANPGSRRGYLRVTLEHGADGIGARLTGDQGSGILRSMVAADGLAVIAGDTTVPEGAPVDVIVLRTA
ncbi:MAG: molybdopterin molybdotransferase MoeA [Candidatus Rokubacteria bacterium]|nr:molybdopterin molybdotransferase MoeA [Candidatus Rokubacteria bacterium]